MVPVATHWSPADPAEWRARSPNRGAAGGAAGRSEAGAAVAAERGHLRREEDGRGLKVGKEKADRRAGALARGSRALGGGAGRAEEEGRAEARGACLGRRGREGGGCRCALGAVCARSSAQGGRWPRRESWGDARGPPEAWLGTLR